jgi:hypothetical protein
MNCAYLFSKTHTYATSEACCLYDGTYEELRELTKNILWVFRKLRSVSGIKASEIDEPKELTFWTKLFSLVSRLVLSMVESTVSSLTT